MNELSAWHVILGDGAGGDEAALIEAAKGSSEAFGELYQRYVGRIYHYLRARSDSEEEAADLTQQVFEQALKALPKYRDRGAPFVAWLFRIARNSAINAGRRRRANLAWHRVPESLHPVDNRSLEADALKDEAHRRLWNLLARLDPGERELVTLHFMSELTLREISLVVGTSQATVQRRLTRTLRSLKEQYDEG